MAGKFQQWEYQTLEVLPLTPQALHRAALNAGKQGWELCSTVTAMKDMTGGMLLKGISAPPPQEVAIMTFKRPVGWVVEEADTDEFVASIG